MSEQRKKNEKNFLVQGSILAIAGVITKLIGAFYRIPLLNIIGTEGNGYYSRFYAAATKHISIGKEEIGVHLSYLYNKRKEYKLNGIAAGISYNPTFAPELRMIAEYDSKDFALGATYLLLKHLHIQVELQKMKYFTGGLCFQFRLK